MKTCSITDCCSVILARGMCRKHYLRWYKHGDASIVKDTLDGVRKAADVNRTHGLWNHPLYPTWHTMMARCYKQTNKKYKNYGGRGIGVCERWHSVANFISDLSPRPEGMTLDRVNNDGNYEPSNCRWATVLQQARNRPQAKLTDLQRNEILRMYAETRSPKAIAAALGVRPGDVKNVAYGEARRLNALEALRLSRAQMS